jgi:hypothetical protein
MRKILLMAFVCVGLFAFEGKTAQAQFGSSRLADLSRRLADQASSLADKSYFDYRGQRNSAEVTEALFFAYQFNASAQLFRQMVRDNRSPDELRDAARALDRIGRDLSRRFDASRFFSARSYFNDSQATLRDILREVNADSSFGNDDFHRPRPDDADNPRVTGRVIWRGRVDDNVQLVVRGGQIEVRTISGTPYTNATYNFTSPLPRRRVNVSLKVVKGRGDVRILQQPSRDNDFTAVIEILDKKGGASDYEIELTW